MLTRIFIIACKYGNLNIAKYVIKNENVNDDFVYACIESVCYYDQLNILTLLFEHTKEENKEKLYNCFLLCIDSGSMLCMNLLLEKYPEFLNKWANEVSKKRIDCMKILIDKLKVF